MTQEKRRSLTWEAVNLIKSSYAKNHGGIIHKGNSPARDERLVALKENTAKQ